MKARARQQGVALLTALLVTALAVVLVCDLFRQQQVMVRTMEGRQLQLQARLAMRGMLDDTRLLLADDARAEGNVTTLRGRWNLALPDLPLPDLPGADLQAEGGAAPAHIRRAIVDAQSRFNLRNLASGGAVNPYQLAAFARLLSTLGLDPALARPVAASIARATTAGLLAPADAADLAGMGAGAGTGLDQPSLARLRSFVTLLPEPTAININTAPAEVLTAVAMLSLTEAQAVVAQRERAPFRGNGDFALRLNDKETLEGVDYQTSSSYFLVQGSVQLERVQLDAQALVRRSGDGAATLLWLRQERAPAIPGAPPGSR